ncbi:MAG: LamG domain-containing protein, partial [Patescibacteria group bacterium]
GRRGDLGSSPLYFNGTIDDHRVYDRVLSAAEIKRLYNIGNISKISVSSSTDLLSTGLVGHWTFDGKKTPWTSSTAGTALDSSGNSNTGTLTSMVQSTNPVAGRIGQALTFDGTNDWIQMSNESTFDFEKTTAFSVFAWVKTTASSDSFVVAKAQNSGTYTGWYIFVDNGAGSQGSTGTGQIAVDFNSGANLRRRYGTTVVKDGKWHHVGFVNDGLGVATSVKIYVDGTENSTATGTNSVPSSILTNVNVSVGSRDAGGVPYPGAIDDVRIFNRAVSTAEILRLYKMGSGLVVKNLDPYYNSVVLLLHMNGANGSTTFTDSSSSAHTVTSYLGTSTLSTALYKFATASGLMAGGHGLYLDGGTDFTYGTADFTIESWVRLTGGTGVEQNYYDGRDSFSAVMPRIYKSTSEKLIYFTAGAVKITGTTSLTQNVWYHVAVSRYNGSTKLFLDGVQEGSTYTDTNSYVTAASRPAIGVDGAFGGNYITGYLDDYRITKGVARYTTTFTPPAVEFGNVRR